MQRSMRMLAVGIFAALLAFGFFSPGIFTESTRVAYIESEEVMKRYYDWQQAQQRIDGAANAWKKELEGMQTALRQRQDSLEKYRLILTPSEKDVMGKSVGEMKSKIQDFWSKKFGPGTSEYSQLNAEVMKPIYEKVFAVIQEVAKEDHYDYVFDKTGEVLLLYANPAHDLTRDVMDKLGIKDTVGVPARTPTGAAPPVRVPPPGQRDVPPQPGDANRPH